ncbi:MAG: right-handed parallel beta-helix repeat-containing protein [Planctomycetota bacterium]|jgi:predicted outer membrane repeat protein
MRKPVFAFVCVLFAISARAEIIIVDDDGVGVFNNIQAAIDDSNDGDTVMVAPGTYTGPGNGDINFYGKAITVRSVAPENPHIVAATVIDCNEGFHDVGFRFHSYEGPNSVVDGLTITGGVGSGISCSSSPTIRNCAVRDWRGGGIRLWRSNATISNCTFEGNLAVVGGALYCGGESTGSDATIINCTFTNNFAGYGGAVYCGGESTGSDAAIINCTFTNNFADYGGAVYCGGESTGGKATITNCTFTNNSANYGGGMYSESRSNPILTSCTFAGNTASRDGGGIFCDGDDYSASTPTITNCAFADNSAYYGGAVFCSGPWMSPIPNGAFIENCTFSGNSAVSRGGGIYCRRYSRALITNCTFTGNAAHRCDTGFSGRGGGAVYGCRGEIRHCTITYNRTGANGGGLYRCKRVVNCVIRGNSAGQDGGGTCGCSEIANCVVTGNSADRNGGGICMGYFYEYEIITNCTITANWAGSEEGGGGGVFCYYGGFPVTNCILWANADPSGTGESAQIGGDVYFVTVTFGCIQDDDPNDGNVPFGGAENNNIDDNPMFVRRADDGGDGWGDDPCTPEVNEAANDDFGDLHLAVSSPCINTGRPGLTAGWNRMDIDGQPRVMGGRVDMGADEYALIILVAKPEGGEVWVSGSKHEIKWESYGAVGTVDILLSTNSGSGWTTIEDDIANSGSYFWRLPQEVDSNRCVISVVPGKPDPDVICMESGMFTIHPDTPGAPVASKWKSLGGDFERAGLSANYGPELGCVKWQFQTEGPVSASPTIGAEDRVHIACEDGKLYTLDANGVLLWSYETGSSLISAPTVGPDGSVYVGSESGRLYAIDINGNIRWTHTADGFIYSSPAVSPETNDVYVCSSNGTLYALAQDGSELWSFQTGTAGVIGSAIFASPALGSDGTVYIGGFNDANLYALDPNRRTEQYTRPCCSTPTFTPSTLRRGISCGHCGLLNRPARGTKLKAMWMAGPSRSWDRTAPSTLALTTHACVRSAPAALSSGSPGSEWTMALC